MNDQFILKLFFLSLNNFHTAYQSRGGVHIRTRPKSSCKGRNQRILIVFYLIEMIFHFHVQQYVVFVFVQILIVFRRFLVLGARFPQIFSVEQVIFPLNKGFQFWTLFFVFRRFWSNLMIVDFLFSGPILFYLAISPGPNGFY